jgi:hypothetical protein
MPALLYVEPGKDRLVGSDGQGSDEARGGEVTSTSRYTTVWPAPEKDLRGGAGHHEGDGHVRDGPGFVRARRRQVRAVET